VDCIVSHIEVNHRHGVGVLLGRLFGPGENIVSIRSQEYFGGHQNFGAKHACVPDPERIPESIEGIAIERILCVPYFPADASNALALHKLTDAPMCTYIMDDQNLCSSGIPDELLARLLEKSTLRLAISSELCAGYQKKFGYAMALMPPLAPAELIPAKPNLLPDILPDDRLHHREALLIGNIWGQRWMDLLRATLRSAGVAVQWHNHAEFGFEWIAREDLRRDGLFPNETDESDQALVAALRQAAFVVVPSGTLDDQDDRRFIAQFSLPSRIPFVFATSHAPILVLGSPESAAARFVTSKGIGMVSPYEGEAFQDAVLRIWDPDENRRMREAAFGLSRRYSDEGAADWIWQSLEKGTLVDDRFASGDSKIV
jgi:hypothetical protein